MIIDAHAHIWEENWLPQWFWNHMFEAMSRFLGEEEARKRLASMWDGSGDTMVRGMDEAGIDKTMICCLDYGLTDHLGEAGISIEEQNRLHYEATRRHPDRLIFAVGVDPRRKNAVQIVERGVKEWGAKALKLYPPCGFYPNDRIVYPLYEKCLELGILVNYHTGPIFGPLRSKYSQPIHLDDVATDFPELTILATHTGHGSWQEMLSIARSNPNIICDLAGWQVWTIKHSLRFYETMRFIMDMLGPGRLIFASDHTGSSDPSPYVRWLKVFTEIPDSVKEAGIEFTEQEMADYLGGTASRILHLEGE